MSFLLLPHWKKDFHGWNLHAPASLLSGDSNFLSLSRYPTLRTQTCVLALWWSGPTSTLHTTYIQVRIIYLMRELQYVDLELALSPSIVWVQQLIRGCWVKIGSVWVKHHTYTQLTIKEPNTTLQFIMGTDNTKSSGWLGVNAAPLVKKTRLYCIHTYKNLTHIQLRPDVGHSLGDGDRNIHFMIVSIFSWCLQGPPAVARPLSPVRSHVWLKILFRQQPMYNTVLAKQRSSRTLEETKQHFWLCAMEETEKIRLTKSSAHQVTFTN